MIALSNAQALAKVKCVEASIVKFQGGWFDASEQLIGFLHLATTTGIKSMVVVDRRDIPIMIEDISALAAQCLLARTSALTMYYDAYTELMSGRSFQLT